ncbi:MAG: hypothetical protein M1818_004864 [Claussenomyces sp. TS43310]|nr:MAG: hypothetical protein M1818_004864 [Claussenomyces sp. TS43310]
MNGDHTELDRFDSESPQHASQQRERDDKMSSGGRPSSDDAAPMNGNGRVDSAPSVAQVDPHAEAVQSVVTSEIGVQTLLNRLKQSIASAKEFALFLKKRSTLEEEHANGLRKICRATHENLRRPEHRQGSFAQSYEEVTRIHERMADNGLQFAGSLHQMHEDLLDMASNIERGRKHWKQTGLAAEQRLQDTESAMKKSKTKYDAVAEDYDRARTGDRQSGKIFGIKGPKSAAQHEEDLHRKVQAADADYAIKVQNAQTSRSELFTRGRPETTKNLLDLIRECDSALTMQMQKFASFNEKLLLHNGLSVSPLKGHSDDQPAGHSLRDLFSAINNELDMNYYIAHQASKVPPKPAEIKYERNPVLNPIQNAGPPHIQRQSEPMQPFGPRQGGPGQFPVASPQPQSSAGQNSMSLNSTAQTPTNQYSLGQNPMMQNPVGQTLKQSHPPDTQQGERSVSTGQATQPQSQYGSNSVGRSDRPVPQYASNASTGGSGGPPQLSSLPFQSSTTSPTPFQSGSSFSAQASLPSQKQLSTPPGNLLPVKPVFGITLDELFERDGSAVPMVVYQCMQAVDLYGLEVEGIYRLSGTSSHVNNIKAMFDNDAARVDFRNPENFFHDVNSVAGLLKQFFRDLPDPLLTSEHYAGFINAANIEDDTVRRDALHAIINSLPDPNYATLRALTLHLNRVQENSAANRMSASNLAIVFGPTLMGANTGPNIQDAGWQVRVIDTILNNTYQIFDDD